MNGVINIYKESGFTSHDVVAKLRGILKQKKIGHTGTLDPEAQGVLPVCLGNATKLCGMLTEKDKEYVAEVRFGITTDTQDMTGRILSETKPDFSKERLQEALDSFVGAYDQLPPMYSAVKMNGKKLYELAREGKEVARSKRTVTIYEIELLEVHMPLCKIRVSCSKGTYIRTLAADIGEVLGCGAAMESLVRTKSGRFGIQTAISLSRLEELVKEGNVQSVLLPVESFFEEDTPVHVITPCRKLIENGNPFLLHQIKERRCFGEGENVRVYDEAGRFYGIYRFAERAGRFEPVRMFLEGDEAVWKSLPERRILQ